MGQPEDPSLLTDLDKMMGLRRKLIPRQIISIDMATNTCPQPVQDLTFFIRKRIIQDHGKGNIMLGNWYPIYGSEPEVVVPYLYVIFKNMFDRVSYQGRSNRLRLLECGSGYGEVGAVASLAGFDVYNIEINEKTHQEALRYYDMLKQEGIIDPARLHHIQGTYYDAFRFNFAAENYMKRMGIDDRSYYPFQPEAVSFELGLDYLPTREQSRLAVLHLGESKGALNRSGLINGDGYLDADVVHIYPSDPLFPHGFLRQMSDICYSGTYLLTPQINSQIIHAINSGALGSQQFSLDVCYQMAGLNSFSYLAFLIEPYC